MTKPEEPEEATWKCIACGSYHPDSYKFCPNTGEPRDQVMGSIPVGWRSRPEAWDKLKTAVDGLESDELLALGLCRIDAVPEPDTQPVLSPQFRDFALQRRSNDPVSLQISQLPSPGSSGFRMDIVGPYLNRELPMVRFALHYIAGDVEDGELVARQIINEWHGFDRDFGLDG
jgi:hypothetical protein